MSGIPSSPVALIGVRSWTLSVVLYWLMSWRTTLVSWPSGPSRLFWQDQTRSSSGKLSTHSWDFLCTCSFEIVVWCRERVMLIRVHWTDIAHTMSDPSDCKWYIQDKYNQIMPLQRSWFSANFCSPRDPFWITTFVRVWNLASYCTMNGWYQNVEWGPVYNQGKTGILEVQYIPHMKNVLLISFLLIPKRLYTYEKSW